ncbi:hypothetical protein [Bradyrhizobium sp. sBnM-33]|uniref:hypothetical protein n=1 Tax=Bradyrhizobium sp. sBnM-33 TaxID=2831780 RepID=UPI001BD0BDAD|nr:hypothetical protein [Bradyrhizobium sp. sBnM-33]WOH53788.1 hypothetical protein RX328_17870 [Bradyrhizobium sp. sBnM-33]
MNHRNLSLGGSALEEHIVVRVRNDHHTRLRKLSALLYSSATTWAMRFAHSRLLGCFPHHQDGVQNVKDVKKISHRGRINSGDR